MGQTLLFGAHKGRPLADVPASYLIWLGRTCKLSSGLRAAVASELARRGVAAPPPPAPKPEPLCPRCHPDTGIGYQWTQDSLGRAQIRRECLGCGTWLGHAPQVRPFTDYADAEVSKTPLLDVLVMAEESGVRLRNGGRAVTFATSADWRNAPDRLRRALRQCRHTLARMMPVDR
jgi:hypothetical protein